MNSAPRVSTNYALIIDPAFPSDWEMPFANLAQGRLRAPVIVRTAREAVHHLSDIQMRFGAIYLNPIITPPGALSLIRLIHEYQTATPIFVVHDGTEPCPFDEQEMNRLAIQGAVQRRDHAQFIRELRKPILALDEMKNEDPLEEPALGPSPSEFIPVPIQRFLFTSRLFFDLFIKVADEKFVKILSAGSSFPEDRLKNYLKKDVSVFYFKREHHQRCLEYCTLLEQTFVGSKGVSDGFKVTQTLNRGHSILDILRDSRRVAPSELEPVVNFVFDVQRLLAHLKLASRPEVHALLNGVSSYEHSLGTTVISALLAKAMKIESEHTIEILGLGSFLHDIGLYRMPPVVQSEDLSQMIGDQKRLYFSHPAEGAQILRDCGTVHPVVIQVVAQHHERRNGTGFPNKVSGQEIHKISEIIAFSEEFARLVQSRQGQALPKIIKEMEQSSFESFSIPVIEAFQKVFGE